MSPRHATKTSFRPKEGQRFARAVKVSLHDTEMERLRDEAREDGVTPSEWARQTIRERLNILYGDGAP